MQKTQQLLNKRMPKGSGFGSSQAREKGDYAYQQAKASPFKGVPANYQESSVVKKSFNVSLSPKAMAKY